MLASTRLSAQQMAVEFRNLKSNTKAQEGSASDLDRNPRKAHLQDTRELGESAQGINDLFMTTDSKGDFASGIYSKTQTVHRHGEITIKKTVAFQERSDGRVETLEQTDTDGDGQLDYLRRQIFTPQTQNGYHFA